MSAAAVPARIKLRKITKRAFVDELLSIILPSRNRAPERSKIFEIQNL